VVGVPGLLGDGRVFGPLAALLERRPGRFPDLPMVDFEEMVNWLQEEVDGLDRPPHLITGSFGGLVGLALREGSIASISMVATLPSPDLLPRGIRRQADWIRWLPAPLMERAYRRHLAGALREEGLPSTLAGALASRGLSKATLVLRLDAVQSWSPPIRPPAPIHWIRGESDSQAPWSDEEVQQALNPARISTVPGSHRPYASDPSALLEQLEAWWSWTEQT
jgi:hypothetical protein